MESKCMIDEEQLGMYFGQVEINECRNGNGKLLQMQFVEEPSMRTHCNVLNDDINDALGGLGDAEITFDEVSSQATLSFSKVSDSGDSLDMFTCVGTTCTASAAGDDTTYDCPTMSCELSCEVGSDGACTQMLNCSCTPSWATPRTRPTR